MVELVLRFIFFFIILIGFTEFYFIKLKIKSEFIPIILFSTLGMIMFFAGLLNVMLEVLFILIFLSVFHLIYSIIKKEFTFKVFTPGILYFLAFSLYLAFFLRGIKFIAYDDFSHWGLVARDIITNNKLPNFESLIIFQSYPTGSASFIYFVSKIIGESEGVMLFAQNLLILSCIVPLFIFIKKNKIISYFIIFLSTIFFLTSNVGSQALSVDALLSMMCLASSAIIIYTYNNSNYKWVFLQILPILSLLMIIKNSGILFVIINVLLLFYYSIKYEDDKIKSIKKIIITLSVPYTVKVLWEKHVLLVFSKGFESKHAVSIESYKNIFHEKTEIDIQLILDKFVKRSLDIHQAEIKILILCLVSFILIATFIDFKSLENKENGNLGMKLFFSNVVLYVFYQLGLLSTYIFSMPIGEAVVLASYERYNLTIVMYIYGILLVNLLILLNKNELIFKNKLCKISIIFWCIIVGIAPLYWEHPASYELIEKEQDIRKDISIIDSIYQSNMLSENEKYIIYLSNHPEINGSSYFYYAAFYTLYSKDIKIITNKEINEIDLVNGKTNLIILRDDDIINKKLKNMGIKEYKQIVQLD